MKILVLKDLNKSQAKFLLILFLGLSLQGHSQTPEVLFESANVAYQKEAYQEALEAYKKIEVQQVASFALYYNMGNAYYKLNQIAPAIYYFEKALQLEPNSQEALNNRAFAQRMTIDNIEVLPKTFLQRLDNQYIEIINFDTWAFIAVSTSLLFVFLFLSYYFSLYATRKRLYFISASGVLIISIFSFGFAYKGFTDAQHNKPAIVFVQSSSVKEAPTPNSNEAFELHEGTKVLILEKVGTWQKIKLADGKIGWITLSDLKAL